MKSVTLDHPQKLRTFFEDFVTVHPQNELLLLKVTSEIFKNSAEEIFQLGERFNRIQLKVPHSEIEIYSEYKELINKSKFGLCVECELLPHPDFEIAEDMYRVTAPARFSSASQQFEVWKRVFPETHVTCEIELNAKYLSRLAPTLQAISDYEPSFIVLNPEGLTWSDAPRLKDELLHYQIYSKNLVHVYFSPDHPYRLHWDARTENVLRGPLDVDIDLSNACTHNCNFCTLYSNAAQESFEKEGSAPFIKKLMKQKVEREDTLKLISELSEQTDLITFGGVGDPLTHTSFFEIAEATLKRGFRINVISNFSYFTDEKIKRLSELAPPADMSIFFQVNISAGRASTYTQIRDNQSERIFEKVVDHLKLSNEIYRKHGRGIQHRLINVTTKDNFRDLPEMVGLAHYVGSQDLWVKPLELHSEINHPLKIEGQDLQEYATKAKLTLHFADLLGVKIYDRALLEEVIRENSKSTFFSTKRSGSFERLVQEEIESSKYLKFCLKNIGDSSLGRFDPKRSPKELYEKVKLYVMAPKAQKIKAKRVRRTFGASKTGSSMAATYFSHLPCNIAFDYIRISTNSEWTPCCISNYPIHRDSREPFLKTWTSGRLSQFREKLKKIHTEQFHMNDPQWSFCQQCVHRLPNEKFNQRAGKVLDYV